MSKFPPPTEILVEYAAGSASSGVSLLVASHLSRCAASRDLVAELEAFGGATLMDTAPERMGDHALLDTLEKLDAPEEPARPARRIADIGPLPRPILDALGTGFSEIPWRFRLPGLSEYEFSAGEGERVSLLRARPGTGVPQHTHEGRELTLILAGAMADGGQIYRAGDVAVNDEADDHKPVIVGDETCYCLIVLDGGLRFTGRFGRALNLLAE